MAAYFVFPRFRPDHALLAKQLSTSGVPLHTLTFTSPPSAFRILGTDKPFSATYSGWDLREQFEADTEERGGDSYGTYSLTVEKSVGTGIELSDSEFAGVMLIEDIERLWAFAAGLPLRHNGFGLHLVPIEPPPGWASNAREVRRQVSEMFAELVVSPNRHWRSASAFPLRAVHAALIAYAEADPLTKAVIEIHYEAMMTPTHDGPYFLLSKALEMVRAMLPGRTDAQKQRNLPPEVGSRLSHGLHWLFDLANHRLNTRHAIDRRGGGDPSLHPPMAGQEGLTFLREADLVVRAVVCSRMNLALVVINY